MNKYTASLGLAFILSLYSLTQPVAASTDLTAQEKTTLNSESTAPIFTSGQLTGPSVQPAKEVVLTYLSKKQGAYTAAANEEISYEVIKESTDALGFKHVNLQQLYKGIPVFGAELSGHLNQSGTLTAISGEPVQQLSVDSKAGIDGNKAAQRALEDIQKVIGGSPQLEEEAAAQLVIYMKEKQPHLAYTVELEFLYPEPGNYRYFIDAQTGAVIESFNQLHEADPNALAGADSVGNGKGVFSDAKPLNTVSNSSGSYLADRTRGRGIYTFDAKNLDSIPGSLWLDSDNLYNEKYDGAAVDAHVYAAKTYDYYKKIHGRNSYDGQGAQIVSTVHFGKNYNNAFWSGAQMVYGDGDGSAFDPLSGALDVVAHELTHAVTASTANLLYVNESGAINESMSDIFGTLVEYQFSRNPDWLIGEDVFTPGVKGDALRSLQNPAVSGHPDHYSKRYVGTKDNGGVHWNSGISNKAAYLLANGGVHYGVTVPGIGIDKMGSIFYRTLTVYLTPNSTFSQYRAAAIQSATDLYGASSDEAASVAAAFSAVGVH